MKEKIIKNVPYIMVTIATLLFVIIIWSIAPEKDIVNTKIIGTIIIICSWIFAIWLMKKFMKNE